MRKTTLESERLVLRTANKSDAESVWHYYQTNMAHFRQWSPRFPENILSRAYFKDMIRIEQQMARDGTHLRLFLYDKEHLHGNSILGDLNFTNIVRGPFQSCYLGYKMAEQSTGKGYMTEAISAATEYAFDFLNLHRVEANIMPRNQASVRTIEKCGFVEEGLSKEYLQINGKWEDHLHFVKLNANWTD